MVVIVGPTASGKTAFGIALARELGGEIVSADSQQVYRELEIGTAKPAAEERAAVPHHLIDFAEPTEVLSAGRYARLADEQIAAICARGRLPIVVGGTGLWVRALLFGIAEIPPADAELRARLEALAEREGRRALHARLAAVDPESAAAIPPGNAVRVIRALEIYELTGEKPSVVRARHGFAKLRYRARVFGISPPREALYRRIDQRARAMFESGLIEEVKGLVARGLRDAPALKALGYPQALAVVEGRVSVEEAIAATAQASRHYAKRQLTWFRADPLVQWLEWPPDALALAAHLRSE
jgi:tRNA dimethylallyltransferase